MSLVIVRRRRGLVGIVRTVKVVRVVRVLLLVQVVLVKVMRWQTAVVRLKCWRKRVYC